MCLDEKHSTEVSDDPSLFCIYLSLPPFRRYRHQIPHASLHSSNNLIIFFKLWWVAAKFKREEKKGRIKGEMKPIRAVYGSDLSLLRPHALLFPYSSSGLIRNAWNAIWHVEFHILKQTHLPTNTHMCTHTHSGFWDSHSFGKRNGDDITRQAAVNTLDWWMAVAAKTADVSVDGLWSLAVAVPEAQLAKPFSRLCRGPGSMCYTGEAD